MAQSKPIQRIEIPSKNIISEELPSKDTSFHLWEFLSTKSTDGSNCPVRGSLAFARESPLIFASILIAMSILVSILSSSKLLHL